mgnify:FL=1
MEINDEEGDAKTEFYKYGEAIGLKINDLQRLMCLAKKHCESIAPKPVVEERMVIHSSSFGNNLKNIPNSIPMKLLSEVQAQSNHGQTLSGLNSRGGLGILEMLDNLNSRRLTRRPETQDDVNELNAFVSSSQIKHVVDQWTSVDEGMPDKKGYYLTVIDEDIASSRHGSVEIQECYEAVKDKSMVLKFQDYVLYWMPKPEPPAKK